MSSDPDDDEGRGGLRPLPLGLAAGQAAGPDGPAAPAGIGPGGRPAVGGLARGARGFATRIGLGFTARRAGLARIDLATDALSVRPPLDFWPGGTDEPHPLDRVRTGDPAYDRLVNQRRAASAATAGRRGSADGSERIGRGLPASIHRRGRTVAGPRTAPGAGGMRPGEIRPAPNEATRLAPSASSPVPSSVSSSASRASGSRPRTPSGPAAGAGRRSDQGSTGRGDGGRPGPDDDDLAALRAAIVARREQTGGPAASSPSPSGSASGRPGPGRHGASGEPTPDPGGSTAGPDIVPADRPSGRAVSSAADGSPARHGSAASASAASGDGQPATPDTRRPVGRGADGPGVGSPAAWSEHRGDGANGREADGAGPLQRPDDTLSNADTNSHDSVQHATDTLGKADTNPPDDGVARTTDTLGNTDTNPPGGTGDEGDGTGRAAADAGPGDQDHRVGPDSAADGLPVRFSGLVAVQGEAVPAPEADRPTFPRGVATSASGPPPAHSSAARSARPSGTASTPVAATAPAASGARPDVAGSSSPTATDGHEPRQLGTQRTTGDGVGEKITGRRHPSELFTQRTTGDGVSEKITGRRHPSEPFTQRTTGDGVGEKVGGGRASNRAATGGTAGDEAEGDPGVRFLSALGAGRPDRPTSLPRRFRPLARALTGGAAVSIVTGAATRRALDVVGSAAATVGRTIYLAEAPGTGRRHREILAHELIHAARPSPLPRFFADPRPSAEERLAHHTGQRFAAGLPLAAASLGSTRFAGPSAGSPGPATALALEVVSAGPVVAAGAFPGNGIPDAGPSATPAYGRGAVTGASSPVSPASHREAVPGTSLSGASAPAGAGPTGAAPPAHGAVSDGFHRNHAADGGEAPGEGPLIGPPPGLGLVRRSPNGTDRAVTTDPSGWRLDGGRAPGRVAPTVERLPGDGRRGSRAPFVAGFPVHLARAANAIGVSERSGPGLTDRVAPAARPVGAGAPLDLRRAPGDTPRASGTADSRAPLGSAPSGRLALSASPITNLTSTGSAPSGRLALSARSIAGSTIEIAGPIGAGRIGAGSTVGIDRSMVTAVPPAVGAGLRRAMAATGSLTPGTVDLTGGNEATITGRPSTSTDGSRRTGPVHPGPVALAAGLRRWGGTVVGRPGGAATTGRTPSAAEPGTATGGGISRHASELRRESLGIRGFRDAVRPGGAVSAPGASGHEPAAPATPATRATMGTAGLPVGGLGNLLGVTTTASADSGDTAVARRQTVHREQTRRPGGDPTQGALLAAGGGAPAANQPTTTNPAAGSGGTPPTDTGGPTGGGGGGGNGTGGSGAPTQAAADPAPPPPTTSAFDDFDRLVELLEERLLAELERRGARFRGGPF